MCRRGDRPTLGQYSACVSSSQGLGPFKPFEPCILSPARLIVNAWTRLSTLAVLRSYRLPNANPSRIKNQQTISPTNFLEPRKQYFMDAAICGQHAPIGGERAAMREIERLAVEIAHPSAGFFHAN